jgi:hypothetical protein
MCGLCDLVVGSRAEMNRNKELNNVACAVFFDLSKKEKEIGYFCAI